MGIRAVATIAGGAIVVALAVVLYVLTRTTESVTPAVPPMIATATTAPIAPRAPLVVTRAPLAGDAVATRVDGGSSNGPREERELLSRRIRDARAGYEPWDDQGQALINAIARGPITATDVGCYMAGCIAVLTFPSDAVYRRALAELQANAAYLAWTGSKQLTSPETLDDGRVVIAIVLQRPD